MAAELDAFVAPHDRRQVLEGVHRALAAASWDCDAIAAGIKDVGVVLSNGRKSKRAHVLKSTRHAVRFER